MEGENWQEEPTAKTREPLRCVQHSALPKEGEKEKPQEGLGPQ